MRFPRQAKIFRGQLDVAPVAALFFLLVMMLMLAQASSVIPGVRVSLDPQKEMAFDPDRTLFLRKDNTVEFSESEYSVHDLSELFRKENAAGRLPRTFFFDYAPGSNPELIERLRVLALETGIQLKPPGSRLELPEHAGFPGTTNPVVVLAVNLNGQLFLEHQLIPEDALEQRLKTIASKSSRPLSLVLQADKDVRHGKVIHLMSIAAKAGISEVIHATRPAIQPE